MAALDRVKVLVLGDSGECPSPRPVRARIARAGGGVLFPPLSPLPPAAGPVAGPLRRCRAAHAPPSLARLLRLARPPADWGRAGGSPRSLGGAAQGPCPPPVVYRGAGSAGAPAGPWGFAPLHPFPLCSGRWALTVGRSPLLPGPPACS